MSDMNEVKPPVFDLALKGQSKTAPAQQGTDTAFEEAGPAPKPSPKPSPKPYARAQVAWEDRHGALKAERERWFRVAMVLVATVIVTTALAVWAAVRTEYVPHIVVVDELGQRVPVIAPRAISDWPDQAVRREITDFIRDWRSVSTDRAVMRGRLRRIQFYLEENSAADRKIVAWARAPATDPFKRAESSTVDIGMHNVNFLGGNSWIAEWTETTRNRNNGRVTQTDTYKATVSLGRRKVSDEAVLIRNPFGMVVEDIDVVRLSE